MSQHINFLAEVQEQTSNEEDQDEAIWLHLKMVDGSSLIVDPQSIDADVDCIRGRIAYANNPAYQCRKALLQGRHIMWVELLTVDERIDLQKLLEESKIS